MGGEMTGFFWVFVFLAAVLVGVAAWRSAVRKKALTVWADSRGLTLLAGRDTGFDDRYPAFRALRRGSSRYAHHRMEGQWNERRVMAFDYHYVTGSGKNRQVHQFSGVLVESTVPLKPLLVRSENILDRIGEAFGMDDLDFESSEFSRAYHVRSSNRRWAYDVLHARTIEFLLQYPKHNFQFDERHVLIWRDRRFDAASFDQALMIATGVLDRLPDYVLRQQTEEVNR